MRHYRTSRKTLSNARELRRDLTEAEARLWQALRRRQLAAIRFRRQHAIGPYIVDFCAPSHQLVIEVDGGQHLDEQVYDAQRTVFLEAKGYRVLRFWNHEVMGHLEGVLEAILGAVGEG